MRIASICLTATLLISACSSESTSPELADGQTLVQSGLINDDSIAEGGDLPGVITASQLSESPPAESQLPVSQPAVSQPAFADDEQSDQEQNDQEHVDSQQTETTNPSDTATYASRSTDPVWRICAADIGIDSRDSWQRQQVQSNSYRDCIKVCPTNSDFIPDPNFPGLGWNNRLRTACAVIDQPDEQLYHPVPLYLPNQQPSRQSFKNIGAFQIHSDGGQWQCTHQQRNLSSEPFTDTGVEISYQFSSDGTVHTLNSNNGASSHDLWWFDGFTGTRIIGLPTATDDEGLLPERYIGNVYISGNSMQIYRTTVDRLSCISERPDTPLIGFPDSIEQVETLPILSLNNLTNKPLSCRAYESLALSLDGQSYTQIGLRSDLDGPQPDVFIDIAQSASIDATGQARYEFQNAATISYTVDDKATFNSTYRHPGEVTRSFAYNLINFRQYNDQVIMTDRFAIGGSGSSSVYVTYSMCAKVQ